MSILLKVIYILTTFICFGQTIQALQPAKGLKGKNMLQRTVIQDNTIVVTPTLSTSAVVNPGKGWVIYGSVKNHCKVRTKLNQEFLTN
jgi:hypothetical protein